MDDAFRYKVVVNHEEQYSIWPEERENPLGWTDVGVSGLQSECLEHIDKVWTDMRPLSLRKWMAENPDNGQDGIEVPIPPTRDLTEFLASKEHEISLVVRGGNARERLVGIIKNGYVQLYFPGTEGGTELTVEIDVAKSELDAIEGNGTEITLVGNLELDYRLVECRATITLATLQGTGCLTLL